MRIFLHDKPWIGDSGDDENDNPCLNEALLQVSDEFDSLSCLCNADIFIRLRVQPQAAAPTGQTNSLYNSITTITCASPTIIAQ